MILPGQKYTVVDKFLNPFVFKKIKDAITGNHIPWYLDQTVNGAQKGEALKKQFFFQHWLYSGEGIYSDYFRLFEPVFEQMGVHALIRVKANLFPNVGEKVKNAMHVDNQFPHKGAILYINTCNGPTTLDDGTEIEAVENRILYFDSSKEHCSSHATDVKQRFTINFNYF